MIVHLSDIIRLMMRLRLLAKHFTLNLYLAKFLRYTAISLNFMVYNMYIFFEDFNVSINLSYLKKSNQIFQQELFRETYFRTCTYDEEFFGL